MPYHYFSPSALTSSPSQLIISQKMKDELRAAQIEYDKLFEETAQETYEGRLRSEKFMKEVFAFFEEMEESTKRTLDLAQKCRNEMDILQNLGNKLQKNWNGLEASGEVEQPKEGEPKEEQPMEEQPVEEQPVEEQDEIGGGELKYVDEALIAVKTEQGKKSPGLSDLE